MKYVTSKCHLLVDLPEELIVKIFKLVPPHENNLNLVNKQFSRLLAAENFSDNELLDLAISHYSFDIHKGCKPLVEELKNIMKAGKEEGTISLDSKHLKIYNRVMNNYMKPPIYLDYNLFKCAFAYRLEKCIPPFRVISKYQQGLAKNRQAKYLALLNQKIKNFSGSKTPPPPPFFLVGKEAAGFVSSALQIAYIDTAETTKETFYMNYYKPMSIPIKAVHPKNISTAKRVRMNKFLKLKKATANDQLLWKLSSDMKDISFPKEEGLSLLFTLTERDSFIDPMAFVPFLDYVKKHFKDDCFLKYANEMMQKISEIPEWSDSRLRKYNIDFLYQLKSTKMIRYFIQYITPDSSPEKHSALFLYHTDKKVTYRQIVKFMNKFCKLEKEKLFRWYVQLVLKQASNQQLEQEIWEVGIQSRNIHLLGILSKFLTGFDFDFLAPR